MSGPRFKGCNEYEDLSRRGFLGLGAKAAALAALGPSWLPNVKFASRDRLDAMFGEERDIIVSVYLRGGCDGLSMCVPYGEPNYYTARPQLAIPRPDSTAAQKAINLNGFFGLAPALQPLKSIYDAGDLLIVHATGSREETKSHFDAQHFMEAGKPDKRVWTGWLGRHLSTAPPMSPTAPVRGVALTYQVPLTVEGGPKTLPLSTLQDYKIGGFDETLEGRRNWLQNAYATADAALANAATNVDATLQMLANLNFQNYTPAGGAVYAENEFSMSLKAAAALIRYEAGIEALHIDYGGWDTHEYQFPLDGQMASLMDTFAVGLRAFYTDLQAAGFMNRVTLVVVSEFGRVLAQNGSYGTDHGHGNCMWLMGGNVIGNRVLTQWPGLAPEQLFEGQDLQVTIDYRDILAEVVHKRLGNTSLSAVFPDYTPTFRGAVAG